MTATLHLHATRDLHRPIGDVTALLRRDGATIAATATDAALAATAEDRAGLAPDAPRVDTRVLDDMAVLEVAWNDAGDLWPPPGRFPFATRPTSPWWRAEEERTGWPSMTMQLVVAPTRDSERTRLAVLSTRTPGVDGSTNRIDRHRRDRIARAAVEEFLSAVTADLEVRLPPAVLA